MVLTIKRSNGELLTQSSSSAAKYLNCEIKVMDGPHAGEFFYPKLTVEGPEPGHETATGITLGSHDFCCSAANSWSPLRAAF
jgi:hypothetical protein